MPAAEVPALSPAMLQTPLALAGPRARWCPNWPGTGWWVALRMGRPGTATAPVCADLPMCLRFHAFAEEPPQRDFLSGFGSPAKGFPSLDHRKHNLANCEGVPRGSTAVAITSPCKSFRSLPQMVFGFARPKMTRGHESGSAISPAVCRGNLTKLPCDIGRQMTSIALEIKYSMKRFGKMPYASATGASAHPENRVVLVDIASDTIETLHGCSASFALSWGYHIAPTQSRALIRSRPIRKYLQRTTAN